MHTLTVAIEENQRLDNFLIKKLKGVPKSLIYRLIRKGVVKVNNKKCKPEHKLKLLDEVKVPSLDIKENTNININSSNLCNLLQYVIFENDQLLVINKPSGIAVHGGSGLNFGLIEALRVYKQDDNLELIHRIDKETSGLLLIAKKRSTLRFLQAAFRERNIKKSYLALVNGIWKQQHQTINTLLEKRTLDSGEWRVYTGFGKPSQTKFTIKKYFDKFATLVEATPITGRTHQIRVHAAYAGNPILGDQKYGSQTDNQLLNQTTNKTRLLLHAHTIEFIDQNNIKQRFTAEPPQDWVNIINAISEKYKNYIPN